MCVCRTYLLFCRVSYYFILSRRVVFWSINSFIWYLFSFPKDGHENKYQIKEFISVFSKMGGSVRLSMRLSVSASGFYAYAFL
jgi:hypothetical protein